MISLGLAHVPREVRETSYTDQVVARLIRAATGVGGDGSTLAAVETAARWWGAGLSSATVKPDNLALRSVSPPVLDSIGRSLCRSGESLHVIDVRHGQVSLTPCGAWSVSGSDDPGSWRYRVTMSGPTANTYYDVRSVQRPFTCGTRLIPIHPGKADRLFNWRLRPSRRLRSWKPRQPVS